MWGSQASVYEEWLERVKENNEIDMIDTQHHDVEQVVALCKVLQKNTSVTHLSINVQPVPIEALCDLLVVNTTIQRLDLAWVFENNKELLRFFLDNALPMNSSVKALDLSGNAIGPAGVLDLLSEFLAVNTTLVSLDLSHNKLRSDGAKHLAFCLQRNTSLKQLYVLDNHFGPDGVVHMADLLMHNTTLRVLYLTNNKPGTVGCAALSKALACNKTLTKLDLGYNDLTYEAAHHLVQGVAKNTTLRYLHVNDNAFLTDKGIAALCQASASLTYLTVRRCEMRSVVVFHDYCFPCCLVHLDVQQNHIEPKEAVAFAEALKKNRTLTSFNCDFNQIRSEGARALARCLCTNQTLRSLCMAGNGIEDDVVPELAHALMCNHSLTHLKIGHNLLSKKAQIQIFSCLQQNGSMLSVETDYYYHGLPKSSFLERNASMHDAAECCVVMLLTIPRSAMFYCPKEIVRMLAKCLWDTRTDVDAWSRCIETSSSSSWFMRLFSL